MNLYLIACCATSPQHVGGPSQNARSRCHVCMNQLLICAQDRGNLVAHNGACSNAEQQFTRKPQRKASCSSLEIISPV